MKTKDAINLCFCLLALSLSFIWSAATNAATIERYSDPVMGCAMLLSGQIVQGDADKLEALVTEKIEESPGANIGRLCFNSTGGSFVEGVRLAQIIRRSHYLGTAISAGHVCESACAVAFMAGGSQVRQQIEISGWMRLGQA